MDEAPDTGVDEALAHELDCTRRALEDLAVELCLDPVVFERHAEALQSFDRLAQVIGEVAGALRRRETPTLAIAGIRLEAMRDRLAAACG